MAYLFANVLGLASWIWLYRRSHHSLKRKMLMMSFFGISLAPFDLLYVPTYWTPQIMFNIPIGLEGIIFSFLLGGVAAASPELFYKKTQFRLKKIQGYSLSIPHFFYFVALCVLLFHVFYSPNISISFFLFMLGTIFSLTRVKGLTKIVLLSSVGTGIIYSLSLFIWAFIFPNTATWFTLVGLPKIFILNVAIYEIIFGFLFGGFWGGLYEFVCGYRSVTFPK